MATATPDQVRWTHEAEIFEYSQAADPIGSGLTPPVPFADFPHRLHEKGPTRIIPFDLSRQMQALGPATGPALLANFVRIVEGDSIVTQPNATSELYYVLRGTGHTGLKDGELPWKQGDFFTLPAGSRAEHHADTDAAFYYVHDEPLLRYLGVKAGAPRFKPTLYPKADADAALDAAVRDPAAATHSRVSVLLANSNFQQTRTITHVLWAMYGTITDGTVQKPHRHQSVALDLIADCRPGCYTLIGSELDGNGNIVEPRRADWEPNSAFVTPPGLWHAHYNQSGAPAYVIPIQDAGLHTYLRTLDIRFT
jgi:gentisate 1,2-dioxygenase